MFGLAAGLVSCGGTHAHRATRTTSTSRTATLRGVVPGSVAMAATPSALLRVCLANTLLHPICPRLGPLADQPQTTIRPLGFCEDRHGGDVNLAGHYSRLASAHCVLAVWGYEASGQLKFAPAAGDRLTVWNGSRWVPLASESGLFPPGTHVHVEIQAALPGTVTTDRWPRRTHRITDSLLTSARATPVSLGWVHWYGTRGQLVLEPNYPAGGEWGGHLVYRFTAATVSYAITLHAWAAALRITRAHGSHVIRLQPGPALPHVIATLKTIVGSALAP